MGYRLTVKRLRVVKKNDKGVVTYRKRYKRGDIVDTDKLQDGRLDQFLASGTLVDEDAEDSGDAEDSETQLDPIGGDEPQGDPHDGPDEDDEPVGGTDAPVGTGDFISDTETPDVYSAMDYADLQREAKNRGLNAGGSQVDLRNRLREADRKEAADEE